MSAREWCSVHQCYHDHASSCLGESLHRHLPHEPESLGDIFLMTTVRGKVLEFHRAMDVPTLPFPQVPPEERVRLRLRLIAEEFFEVIDATLSPKVPGMWNVLKSLVMDYINVAPVKVNMPELADGLCDLDYVVEGTRQEFGIDGGPVLEEVHAANMRKLDGPKREDGKRLKPPGWKPPDIDTVLRKQGWSNVIPMER